MIVGSGSLSDSRFQHVSYLVPVDGEDRSARAGVAATEEAERGAAAGEIAETSETSIDIARKAQDDPKKQHCCPRSRLGECLTYFLDLQVFFTYSLH